MIDLNTKYEVSKFTHYEDMKGNAKCRNLGVWVVRVNRGYQQCHHSMECIRLPIRLKVTIRPGLSRTVLYFWVLSWISRCPGFALDLKSSDPSLENVYLSQYELNVRLLTTAHYLKHPADRKLHEIWSVDS